MWWGSRVDRMSPAQLAQALRYATDWFAIFIEETNALNVYPVPDGDTGTNMHLTLQSLRRELDLSNTEQMGEVARAVSYGSLMGARGNSGVITSQILKGFAEVLRRHSQLTPQVLTEALEEGTQTGYRAVMKPVEGTILTVARYASAGARKALDGGATTLEGILEGALEAAREGLAETPNLLAVLRQADVVDAGGAGYVHWLEGLQAYVLDRPLPPKPVIERYAQTAFEEENFGYCTEFLLENVEQSIEAIREMVAPFGDSLLVVGAEGYVKGHIHTNEPDALLATVARYGTMLRSKVEDMSVQHTEILGMAGAADEAPPPTGLVAVAHGWGLVKAFRGLGARIVAGGQTANPSVQDILDAIRSLPSPAVIVLPNNSNVLMSAGQAAELGRSLGKDVQVLPTRTLGQGLAAAIAFHPDLSASELLPDMETAQARAVTLEVTRASRGASLDGVEVREQQPIGLIDDKLALAAETPEQALLDMVQAQGANKEILTVFHGSQVAPEILTDLPQRVAQINPDLALEIHPGGPDLYDYLAILE